MKKKKRTTKNKTRKKAVSKKQKVNKSEAIRDYKAKHPDAKPVDIAAALSSRGIAVTPGVVSSTLYLARKKKGKTARGKRTAARGRGSGSEGVLDSLLAAKKLAEQLGGIDQARKALDMLARLR